MRYLPLLATLIFAAPMWAQDGVIAVIADPPPPSAGPTQTPAAATAPTPPEGMVYVPAGEFTMGTNESDRSDFNQRDNVPLTANDARPKHKTSTGAFFVDITEVTNAAYQKYCAATGAVPPAYWPGGKVPDGEADFAVHHVNFYEAAAYASWAGKRLPTESEWEKAARGTDERRFPWGNDWGGDRATDDGGPGKTGAHPAGASAYGALDMAGNVAEWTSSWFQPYPDSPTKQPDFGTKLKVVRGGAWIGTDQLGQTWHRQVARPQTRVEMIGFRCVKDAG